MVYTGIMFVDPDLKATPRQIAKMTSAVMREAPEVVPLVDGLRRMKVSPLKFDSRVGRLSGDPLIRFKFSESRRAPEDTHTVPEKDGVLSSIGYLYRRSAWTASRWNMIAPTLEGISAPVISMLELNMTDELKADPSWLPETNQELPEMGVIALIPEPGMKLRFAANPGRIYQSLTGPLGRKLFGLLRQIPNDFTYDQDAGIAFVQECLQKGLPSVSTDLSNATDRFPLELELALLADHGTEPEWLHLLRDLCRGDWYFGNQKRSSSVKRIAWTVGSPLGVYPTFAAFALAHHALVQQLMAEVGVQPDDRGRYPYAIVGDDVTIFEIEVAIRYRKVMESLGVPISEAKSLFARSTSEFLGRLITPDEVIQGFKWKGRCSDFSFVDLARNLGPGALVLLRKRQRDVIRHIAPLPEPLGLGWNPDGLSWSERVGPWFDEFLKERDERVRSFRSSRAHSADLLYSSREFGSISPLKNLGFEGWGAEGDILTSDQEVSELLHEYLPGWSGDHFGEEIWSNILLAALERGVAVESDEKLGRFLREFSSIERSTDVPTLVQWERRIRRILSKN